MRKQWHIITHQRVSHPLFTSISRKKRVSHQPQAVFAFAMMIYNGRPLVIYKAYALMIYTPYGVIRMRECEKLLNCFTKYDIIPLKGGSFMAKQFLWITNTEENIQFYRDSSPKSNLSLHFASAIDHDTKKNICRFVRHLKKEFFFPIRCNVYFCNQEKFHSSKGGYCYGIFYSNEESGGRIYPQIYIPTNMDLFSVYHSLSHELTHYYQWYFLDDNKSEFFYYHNKIDGEWKYEIK